MDISDAEIWRRIQDLFQEESSFLIEVSLESESEATSARKSGKSRKKRGNRVVRENLVRYRRTDDRLELEEHLAEARALIPEIKRHLKSAVLSLQFLHWWGAFLFRCGFIRSTYYSVSDDIGPLNAGKAGAVAVGLASQRKWVSHLILRLLAEDRNRQLAERDVAKAVHNIRTEGMFADGFDDPWFKKILGPDGQLKSTYSQKHLSIKKMREAIGHDALIPATDIPIPKT